MGVGAIPASAITAYVKDVLGNEDPEILQRFIRYVRTVDRAYLDHLNRQTASNGN